jgi:hypothetical protein
MPNMAAQAAAVRSISLFDIESFSALGTLNVLMITTDASILAETLTIAGLLIMVNLGAAE